MTTPKLTPATRNALIKSAAQACRAASLDAHFVLVGADEVLDFYVSNVMPEAEDAEVQEAVLTSMTPDEKAYFSAWYRYDPLLHPEPEATVTVTLTLTEAEAKAVTDAIQTARTPGLTPLTLTEDELSTLTDALSRARLAYLKIADEFVTSGQDNRFLEATRRARAVATLIEKVTSR